MEMLPLAPAARPRLGLAGILLLALLLRLIYLGQVASLPFFDHPVGESQVHLTLASQIAAGSFVPHRPFFYASVLYPYFLAVVLEISRGRILGVALVQVLAGVLLVYLVYRLGARIYGSSAGLWAAALAALYGPFAFFEADVVGVVWALVALTAAMLACVAWGEAEEREGGGRARHLLLAGLAFGCASAERPNLALVVPVAAAWCAARARKHRLGAGTALLGGAALPLVLVVLLDFVAAGQWVPLATSGGINLYIGNHPGATGAYDEPWADRDAQFAARHTELEEASIRMASTLAGRDLTPEQASGLWAGKALAFVSGHPGEAAKLTLRKALLLLNAQEIPNHLNFSFLRRHAPALWSMPVGFGIVLPLGGLGIGLALRDRRRPADTLLLVLVAAAAAASVLPFFVADRFRAPLVPPLLVAAGFGCAELWRLRSADVRRDRSLAWGLAAAVALGGIALLPLSRPELSRDYWMFADAYQARGELRAAAAAYEAAVRTGGDAGELLNNLALTYRALGMREMAEATLRRAVAANPRLAYPHKNLGMVLIARGERSEAMRELLEAVRLEPDDAASWAAIGALRAERGERAAAEAAFARARALAPGDARIARLSDQYLPTVSGPAAAQAAGRAGSR
ncbi:MAG: tetratricopeptide repeat protein [Candidatus Eisenbacteria bacterium]|uniref:Tetratricopeptide repeat protein n=1 Tax=Eiseniibacteriota bacterium TaxID=2212470 RepID=A0A538SM82_UNCEI|nr:MAG: tetratricopeptide repeat protein [Candidatus Eisenbacteria bacterium]